MANSINDVRILRGYAGPMAPFIVDFVGSIKAGEAPETILIEVPVWAETLVTEVTGSAPNVFRTGKQRGVLLGTFSPPVTGTATYAIRAWIHPKKFPVGTNLTFNISRNGTVWPAALHTVVDHFCRQTEDLAPVDAIKLYDHFMCLSPEEAECMMDCMNQGFNIASIALLWDSVVKQTVGLTVHQIVP